MTDGRTVVVTGATGLIGQRLCRRLCEKGYRVVVFARNPATARRTVPDAAEWVAWTAAETGPWASAIDGAHAVVNLAGAPIIGKRWSGAYKKEIRDSRIVATRGLVSAMRAARTKPQVFVSGSAATTRRWTRRPRRGGTSWRASASTGRPRRSTPVTSGYAPP